MMKSKALRVGIDNCYIDFYEMFQRERLDLVYINSKIH